MMRPLEVKGRTHRSDSRTSHSVFVKEICVVVALLILGLLGGCHQKPPNGLDPRIPAANPGQYEHVGDAKTWPNPNLVLDRDGVTLISTAIEGREKTITLHQLRDSLRELPVSAWPYGRVVGYQEIAVRSGNDDDDRLITRNRGEMLEILESMGIDAYGFATG